MWKVLKTYESEAEARVVESFLAAKGLDVQLLGVHSQNTAVAPGSLRMPGLRLMIRDEQMPTAIEMLQEQERSAHLSIVNEDSGVLPVRRPSVWISVGITAAALAALARYLF